MAIKKLTNSFCKSVAHDGNNSVNSYFDTDIKGFVLEVRKSGSKVFNFRFKENGKTRVYKIGDAAVISTEQARAKAKQIKSEITLGSDFYTQQNLHKQTPTLQEFYDKYYLPHIKQHNRSWMTTASVYINHILPLWGNMKMSSITRLMVTEAHNEQITKGFKPATANKLPTFLRSAFNLAIKWEVAGITSNPVSGFDFFDENNKVERYLTKEEAAKLMKAVGESDNKMLKYIVSFLLLTGARRNECLQAKWCDFDFNSMVWTIPLSKSGTAHHIPITQSLQALLDSIPRDTPSSAYVFPAPSGNSYTNIYTSWNHARNKACLQDVRMHDLRHTFASVLVNSGISLYSVQALLGHHNISVTQRYAHLSKDSLTSAADCAASILPSFNETKANNTTTDVKPKNDATEEEEGEGVIKDELAALV